MIDENKDKKIKGENIIPNKSYDKLNNKNNIKKHNIKTYENLVNEEKVFNDEVQEKIF